MSAKAWTKAGEGFYQTLHHTTYPRFEEKAKKRGFSLQVLCELFTERFGES